jgi:hypothetical protein
LTRGGPPAAAAVAHPAVVTRAREVAEDAGLADPILDGWMRRFTGVADRALRRTVLATCVAETDDGSLVGCLARLDARARLGEAASRWMLTELALTPSVLLEMPYDRVLDVYAAARAAGLDDVAARFLGTAAREAPAPTNPHMDADPGTRTALARGRDRMVLDRLLHDRDPRVASALLDNARITERDVVRIAAMRPTHPDILRAIAAHPRWAHRRQVRRAVAFNPATPPPLARQVLATLLRQDLVEIAGSHLLAAPLRDAARAILRDTARTLAREGGPTPDGAGALRGRPEAPPHDEDGPLNPPRSTGEAAPTDATPTPPPTTTAETPGSRAAGSAGTAARRRRGRTRT